MQRSICCKKVLNLSLILQIYDISKKRTGVKGTDSLAKKHLLNGAHDTTALYMWREQNNYSINYNAMRVRCQGFFLALKVVFLLLSLFIM